MKEQTEESVYCCLCIAHIMAGARNKLATEKGISHKSICPPMRSRSGSKTSGKKTDQAFGEKEHTHHKNQSQSK